jgi:hypothetical protein
MNKKLLQTLLAALLTAAMVLAPAAVRAQDNPKTPSKSKETTKSSRAARPIPFRGTIAAVDKKAMTLKVGERVFHIASDTRLIRNNQTTTLADAKVGEVVGGNYVKGDDGKLTAKMIRFGKKSPAPEKAPKKVKASETK